MGILGNNPYVRVCVRVSEFRKVSLDDPVEVVEDGCAQWSSDASRAREERPTRTEVYTLDDDDDEDGDDDACDAGDGESAGDGEDDDYAWKRENGRRGVEPRRIANAGRRRVPRRRRPARGGRW